MSIEQKLCEVKTTPIYVQCNKISRSKVCIQEFWYILSGLDIQPEKSGEDSPARKKAVPGCEIRRDIYWF